ncbi:hypothetical protein SAMN06273572_103316 [Monaibacterium marinum]|uniref:Uncharacterized protein n=1 Tax=Pontivivens marinum TaxID=1690039 RepID=A0A2C9CSQ6_9RHOB|nr:hypothetical protein [Monaibacterium marinum]SOH94282.1 hypothetical protein SAMN06273572_103316 [Monaibacterium marinum]
MRNFGLLALGVVLLIGVFALWRVRRVPRGALVQRFSGLDRGLHACLILALGAMTVPAWHVVAGWCFAVLGVIAVLRRVVRRLLVRRRPKLRASVARFGRMHRLGMIGLALALGGLTVADWHQASGIAVALGVALHVAMMVRDPLACRGMASGFVRMDAARTRWPVWVAALRSQRGVSGKRQRPLL